MLMSVAIRRDTLRRICDGEACGARRFDGSMPCFSFTPQFCASARGIENISLVNKFRHYLATILQL